MRAKDFTETAISLSRLGKFHKGGIDPLNELVPERQGVIFALHPEKWEPTFYSLTNKESWKIKFYGPKQVHITPGTLVGDMAIANEFYRANTPEQKQDAAKRYKDSLQPYPVNIAQYKFPELLIPR